MPGIILDRSTNAGDVHVDRTIERFEHLAARQVHQLFPRQHPARAFGQCHQQFELMRRQRARLAVDPDDAGVAIDLEPAEAQRLRCRCPLRPTQQGLFEWYSRIATEFPDPRLVLKPARLGSSIGISIVHHPDDPAELRAAIDLALRYDDLALAEPYLASPRELEVSVLGNTRLDTVAFGPGVDAARVDRVDTLRGCERVTVV